MTDLLTRLEAAKEGSRELDAMIALHAGLPQEFFGVRFGTRYVDGPEYMDATWVGMGKCWAAPPFTTSIDAITGLIERELPGWKWTVDDDGLVLMWNRKPYPESRVLDVLRGKPPALALCIAFVKAKEAKDE